MNFVLSPEGPLDAGATLSRYRIWGEDPVNRLGDDGVFRRVLPRDGALHPYEVRWRGAVDDARLLVSVPSSRSAPVRAAHSPALLPPHSSTNVRVIEGSRRISAIVKESGRSTMP